MLPINLIFPARIVTRNRQLVLIKHELTFNNKMAVQFMQIARPFYAFVDYYQCHDNNVPKRVHMGKSWLFFYIQLSAFIYTFHALSFSEHKH